MLVFSMILVQLNCDCTSSTHVGDKLCAKENMCHVMTDMTV